MLENEKGEICLLILLAFRVRDVFVFIFISFQLCKLIKASPITFDVDRTAPLRVKGDFLM